MSPILYLIGSLIYAIPSGIAAWYAIKSSKQLKTTNGHTIGEIVESSHDQNKELLRRSSDRRKSDASLEDKIPIP
jgi:hypothetical protein